MKFDIIYVIYNSGKWIKKCFESWLNTNYNLKNVNIYVVDNNSADDSLNILNEFINKNGNKFGNIQVIEEKKNWGFGKANNIGFSKGDSEVVCFLNIDTEVMPDTMEKLENEISNSNSDVALWEFRQLPYEHPKIYDILTGETLWSSGAAFAVKRDVFQKLNGFDDAIFMYAEDVDLSWRIRSMGYKLKYVPKVKIYHYSYETAGEVKPNQYIYSVINNLLLRYRFGDLYNIIKGHISFWAIMTQKDVFSGSRKMLLKQYGKHFFKIPHFIASGKYKNRDMFKNAFYGWDYSVNRDGAFYENILPCKQPLVSIIVRTCGRPNVLRENLISLRQQTYENFEVVIVEDGLNVSEKMINDEFSDLNILYYATGEKVGRSKAGNIAMEMAHGEYLNFLDDDDLFFADHIEVLVETLLKEKTLAAYSTSFETPIQIISKDPYKYVIKDYNGVHKQKFNRIMLCHHNYIPIQCIMFSKKLFIEYGGLDENVDALEDWDMWVRYSLHTDFAFVLKTTSIYRVPYEKNISDKRQKDLDDALTIMREKHKNYIQKISVYDIAKFYEEQN